MIKLDVVGQQPILALKNYSVYRDKFCAVSKLDLDFFPGELVALAGRNGAGKSSLLLAIPVGPSVALTCSFLIFISFIYKSVTSTPLITKAIDARVSIEA